MAQALLLSANKLRNFTDIGPNYNTTDLSNAVRDAQELTLKPLLGKNLYDKIIADVVATTITGDYKLLLDEYCSDVLLWSAYSELVATNYITPRSNGLAIRNVGPGASNVDDQQYQLKQNHIRSKLDVAVSKLDEYLDYKGNLYPELSEATDLPSDERDTNFSPTRRVLGVAKGTNPLDNFELN